MNALKDQTDLQQAFEQMHKASRAQLQVDEPVRRDRLLRLQKMLQTHEQDLTDAVQADFGVRSHRLTQLAELEPVHMQLVLALKRLKKWCSPQRAPDAALFVLNRAFAVHQPLGVVGVIAPWSFPLQTALEPAVAAFAAGNRVMLKPSEHAPSTGSLLEQLVSRYFAADEWLVINGGQAVAAAFVNLPLDHLFFAGAPETGRKVALAAAQHLTPTTLVLGGKNPCVIDADVDLADAAMKIAQGKLLNAGQSCMAVDYVLLPRGQEQAFVAAYRQAALTLYPALPVHPDYPSIISATDWSRLTSMLKQAEQLGAQVHEINGKDASASVFGLSPHGKRQMPPAVVLEVSPSMRLMQEEILGPILPVVSYDHPMDVPKIIQSMPSPLALYWFGRSERAQEKLLAQTISGGVLLNDTLLHAQQPNLPWGSVGASGWGAVRGYAGFLRFSHVRSVARPSSWKGGISQELLAKRFGHILGQVRRGSKRSLATDSQTEK